MGKSDKFLNVQFTQDDTEYGACSTMGTPTFIIDFKNGKGSHIGIGVKDKATAIKIRDMFSSMVEHFDKKEQTNA